MEQYNIMTINPGSTSMKIGVYQNKSEVFSRNFDIPAEKIKSFHTLYDQYLYRKQLLVDAMDDSPIGLGDIDVFVARCGGMVSGPSGLYEVNEQLLAYNDLKGAAQSAQQMGCQFVTDLSAEYGGRGYVINDSAVDEFRDVARVTGMKGVWRNSIAHSLNQKAAAEIVAEAEGTSYKEISAVVAHIGGGVSIGAHDHGKLVDTTNLAGDGPMSPTRTGTLEMSVVIGMLMQKQIEARDLMKLAVINGGGLLSHLGTADGREVEELIADGEEYAKLIYDGMIYQFAQSIARMAVALEGKVDYVILTGGLAHSTYVCQELERQCSWIAPIRVCPGEYEAEAMVSAAIKVLNGDEPVHEYTGKPVFDARKYQ